MNQNYLHKITKINEFASFCVIPWFVSDKNVDYTFFIFWTVQDGEVTNAKTLGHLMSKFCRKQFFPFSCINSIYSDVIWKFVLAALYIAYANSRISDNDTGQWIIFIFGQTSGSGAQESWHSWASLSCRVLKNGKCVTIVFVGEKLRKNSQFVNFLSKKVYFGCYFGLFGQICTLLT